MSGERKDADSATQTPARPVDGFVPAFRRQSGAIRVHLLRDLTTLIMLVYMGLRLDEIAALRLDDPDWRHGEVLCAATPVTVTTAATNQRPRVGSPYL
jgi:integrase